MLHIFEPITFQLEQNELYMSIIQYIADSMMRPEISHLVLIWKDQNVPHTEKNMIMLQRRRLFLQLWKYLFGSVTYKDVLSVIARGNALYVDICHVALFYS